MSWDNFEGVARSRADTLARISALKWTDWDPQGVTLHNTAAPTLVQWAEVGPNHEARIRDLQNYYESDLGWHAGPHFFVSRNWINWFSNPLLPGIHSRCWNATRFGIEQVGDFAVEEYNSGDGALVRDNAMFLVAALNLKFGFDPADVKFHVECARDNHDCPGIKARNKPDLIERIKAQMEMIKGSAYTDVTHPNRQLLVLMTEFAGPDEKPGDRVNGYTEKLIDWEKPGVALPFHLSGPLPEVRVYYGDKSVLCDIVDIGPWTSRVGQDPYWIKGTRPKAESDKRTNGAGIDGTPAVFDALGIAGKIDSRSVRVSWELELPQK